MSAQRKAPVRGPKAPNLTEAIGYIDGAIVDILDSWSMRDSAPNGDCLMSALANLRAARSELMPPRKGPPNADGTVSR